MQTATSTTAPLKKSMPHFAPCASDETLLQSIAVHDDAQSLEALFRRHHDDLCRYVYAILQCRHTTEEIVSDVFLKIWNQRQTLQVQTSLKAYLLISVRNTAIDYLRRQSRRRTVGSDAIHPDLPCDYTSAYDRLIGEETTNLVEAAIERLPRQGRTIFRLSRDGGMKYREIADHLGLSIKTVETHMTRSLVYLRGELAAHIGPGLAM
ncbi:MAG: RNA polymerase sigma-70 factor [Saprospiraceae bacterium]|nr:RNA polymerase sigma-70 factor [Saprospiraceae bacterium]